MVDIVTRTGKGSPLTNAEVDANFTNLKTSAEIHRGTGVTSSYVSSVAVGGTTFSQPAVTGEIHSDEGSVIVSYAGATGVTVATLTATSTYVYIDKNGALQQQSTAPTRQDWSRKMFTMRIAVDLSTNLILGFEYLNNPIGHYANSIRDLYSFLLANGVPFKQNQTVTGRAGGLGFDVGAGSLMEFGGTGDIYNANIKSFDAVANAEFFLATRTAFDAGGNTSLPKYWDNNGVLTALGSTTLVGHRLYRFSNGNFVLQYGQGNYANLTLAKAGAVLEQFVLNPQLANATFFGWWFIESTATNTGGTTLTAFSEYTIGIQGGSSGSLAGCLLKGNNLSDLLDASAARTNLGLGTAATTAATAYATAAQGALAASATQPADLATIATTGNYANLVGTVPTWNQNTTGNAATATNVAYSGLTGTVPTWNQNTTGSSGSTTGNAATATALQTARTIGGVSFNGSANINLPGVNAAGNQDTTGNAATSSSTTGNAGSATVLQTARTIGGVSFNGSANINLPGVNATGNQNTSGSSASTTGNAATATVLQTARTIGGVSFNGSANINLPGVNSAGNQSTTGNAATATTLLSYRAINGVSFNGSANITVEPYVEDAVATSVTRYLTFVDNSTAGYKRLNEDANLSYNPGTNVLTVPTVALSNGSLQLSQGDSTGLRITTAYGYINIGAQNATWTHVYSDKAFYTNQNWYVNGNVMLNAGNYTSYSPTKTGGGASGTWGINVTGNAATATLAANSTLAGGLAIGSGVNNGVNQIVRTNGSGYADFGWINTVSGAASGTPSRVYCSNTSDAYIRYHDMPTFTGYVRDAASGSWGISVTGSSASCTGNAATASNAAGSFIVPGTLTVGNSTSSDIYMVDTDNGTRRIHCNSNQIGFLTQAGGWGSYCDDAGNWTAAGNVTAYSDERLKKDWEEVKPNFVDQLANVKSGTYTRTDSDERQAGVSAQSLQELLPETVIAGGDGLLSVAYGNAAMVAVVELAKEIRMLKEEIKALKGV